MARTFPTVGQSPIDAYTTTKVPATYFETAISSVTTGEEWHGNEIVCTTVLTSGSSYVGQNIVVTATGASGSWLTGSYTKVVYPANTLTSQGYVCAAEFEVNCTGTLQPGDFGVIVLDGNNANTFVMPRTAWLWMNDFGATPIRNLFRLSGISAGSDGDTTSLFAASTSGATLTHSLKFMVGTTPYWIMCSNAQT